MGVRGDTGGTWACRSRRARRVSRAHPALSQCRRLPPPVVVVRVCQMEGISLHPRQSISRKKGSDSGARVFAFYMRTTCVTFREPSFLIKLQALLDLLANNTATGVPTGVRQNCFCFALRSPGRHDAMTFILFCSVTILLSWPPTTHRAGNDAQTAAALRLSLTSFCLVLGIATKSSRLGIKMHCERADRTTGEAGVASSRSSGIWWRKVGGGCGCGCARVDDREVAMRVALL